MKKQLARFGVGFCVACLISTPLFASTSPNVEQLAQQVEQLQSQVNELKAEKTHSSRHQAKPKTRIVKHKNHTDVRVDENAQYSQTADINNLPKHGSRYLPVDLDVPGQSFVTSGPYIGVPLSFSGGNLIINNPSVDQDVALLKVRKNIRTRLQDLGIEEAPGHAHILLSGQVSGQAFYQSVNNVNNASDSSQIDLSNVTLDAYILGPSNWLSSLISLTYDNNSGAQSGSFASNGRTLNSRVYVNQAFITIGDLIATPVYSTFGQLYVPFGTFSSSMISSPLTQQLARTKARAIVLGYQPQVDKTLYASGYIFKGDSFQGSTSVINNGGINLGFRYSQDNVSLNVGGGLIANIADSVGMQDVGNFAFNFNGFGGLNGTGNEQIAHRVPAFDLRGMFSLNDHITLLGEYISATETFSTADLTMNGSGAQPEALNVEAAYTFNAFDRPSAIAIGYGNTADALALGLPARRYDIVFNTSIWRSTLQSLEFRHDQFYSSSDTASGSGVLAAPVFGTSDNVITAQFSIFF